jgi:hypothetical protein
MFGIGGLVSGAIGIGKKAGSFVSNAIVDSGKSKIDKQVDAKVDAKLKAIDWGDTPGSYGLPKTTVAPAAAINTIGGIDQKFVLIGAALVGAVLLFRR